VLLSLSFAVVASAQITVGPNVHVSKANGQRAHFEVLVAADPDNPNHLLGCSIIEATKQPSTQGRHTIVYSSMDGGATWQPTLEVDRGDFSTDPACTFGIDNQAYFTIGIIGAAPGFPASAYANRLGVYRSLDAGRSWRPPVDLPWVDREFIAVDTTRSRYRGNVYINGNGSVRAARDGHAMMGSTFFRSFDGGQTFSYPYLIASAPSHHPPGQTQSSVLADGTIVAAYLDVNDSEGIGLTDRAKTADGAIHVVTSSDSEETFSRPTVAQEVHSCGGSVPSLAADRSGGPFQDHLYLTWTDLRSGRCEILLIKSSDKGKTWSQPIVVNDALPRGTNEERVDPFHIMSVVAVNKEGVVGVMWYDPRDGRDKDGYSVRFSASVDGGETFLPSVRVSEVPASYEMKNWQFWMQAEGGGDSDADAARANLNGSFGVDLWPGHTTGMASTADGTFHPFWVDNRTGLTQVWTATVVVQGRALVNGASELSNWQDLTPKLVMQFANAKFDATKKIATIEAYLVNASKDPIRGPFKLRLLSLQTQMGEVRLIESANSYQGAGAIVNVDREIPNATLEAGARTDAIRLRFSVSDPQLKTIKPVIVEFEAKVLGKADASGSKPSSQ